MSPASRLFTLPFIQAQIKETSKLCFTDLCVGNSPVTGEIPAQRASNAENVSILWRHHGMCSSMCKRLLSTERRRLSPYQGLFTSFFDIRYHFIEKIYIPKPLIGRSDFVYIYQLIKKNFVSCTQESSTWKDPSWMNLAGKVMLLIFIKIWK